MKAFLHDLLKDFSQDIWSIAISTRKAMIAEQKIARKKLFSNESPYGFAFGTILLRLVRDFPNSEDIQREGLSIVVEAGHRNNGGIQSYFNEAVEKGKVFRGTLKSLTFSAKKDSHAIQLADLNAFYSRRHAAKVSRIKDITREQFDEQKEYMFKYLDSLTNGYFGTNDDIAFDVDEAFYETLRMKALVASENYVIPPSGWAR